jgi:8-oxo-dGTP pyrophosphatase MutT (NUDIX family)
MNDTAIPRPAATVLLLRDGPPGIEVFMQVRHQDMAFASGALVFPGGRVDPEDHVLAADADLSPATARLDPLAGALRVAAIRETFEESGVLLVRPRGEAALVSGERLRGLSAGEGGFARMLADAGLVLAADLLVHFAHWITPVYRPRRFDTHFFALAAPVDQLAAHDGTESVESMWIAPREAVAGSAAGRFKLVFATLMNLRRLDRYASVAEALAAAARARVVTVIPTPIIADSRGRNHPLEKASDFRTGASQSFRGLVLHRNWWRAGKAMSARCVFRPRPDTAARFLRWTCRRRNAL